MDVSLLIHAIIDKTQKINNLQHLQINNKTENQVTITLNGLVYVLPYTKKNEKTKLDQLKVRSDTTILLPFPVPFYWL